MRGYKLHISIGIVLIWFLSINCAWAKDGGFATLGPTSEFANEEEEWDEINWNERLVKTLMQINHPAMPKLRLNKETRTFERRWIKGEDMETWAFRSAELSDEAFLKQLIAWAIEVGESLVLLHREGFEHGDLSPTNVVIEENTNQPILIDFAHYSASDVRSVGGLIEDSMYSRVLAMDFHDELLIDDDEIHEATKKRFGRELAELSKPEYSSVAEFVQDLKDYYTRRWPIDSRAQVHLQGAL